jgi:hypothetical protein
VFCTNSFAEINHLPLVPLPSVIDYTHGNGWSGGEQKGQALFKNT